MYTKKLGAISAIFAIFSAQAIATDISGVQLGTPLTTAKSAIANANDKYSITPLKLTNGKEAGIIALTAEKMPGTGITNPGGPSDEFVALQDELGKVWFLARAQRLAQGARVKKDVLIASLREKFGAPSSEEALLAFGMKWEFDRNGKQYIGHPSKGPCFTIASSGSNIPGASMGSPSSFSPTCGKLITASAQIQPDGMVPYFTLQVIDAKSMYDQLNARDARAEADRKRRLEQEQVQGTKPKI